MTALPWLRLTILGAGQHSSKHPDPERQAMVDRFLRVDHAGERGAVRIYEGQAAVLRFLSPESLPTIEEMKQHEQQHLERLEALIPHRRVRPTALLPLWDVMGFALGKLPCWLQGHGSLPALGAGTALLGKRGAMACTVAVEEAIVEHYNTQLRELYKPEFKDEQLLRQVVWRVCGLGGGCGCLWGY